MSLLFSLLGEKTPLLCGGGAVIFLLNTFLFSSFETFKELSLKKKKLDFLSKGKGAPSRLKQHQAEIQTLETKNLAMPPAQTLGKLLNLSGHHFLIVE